MAPGIAFTTTVDDVRLGAQRILDEALSHVTEVAPDVVVRSYLSEAEWAQLLWARAREPISS